MNRGDRDGCLYGRNGKLQCVWKATRKPVGLVAEEVPPGGEDLSLQAVEMAVVVVGECSEEGQGQDERCALGRLVLHCMKVRQQTQILI